MEPDLSFVYMTCLLNVLYNLMKYHKNISKGLRVMYGKPFYYLFYKSDIWFNISDILYNI